MSALLLVLTIPVYAQSKEVVGIVTSAENRDLLSGIVVWVKGTNQGVVTGSDGFFDLTVTEGDTIELSSRFFKTKEVIVGSRWNYDICLETNSRAEFRTGSIRTHISRTEDICSSAYIRSKSAFVKKDWISRK
ncbi:CarboxypepD_reg-like domain-containing protein [Dyadobacter koreensis]|uniref:CarboxypepD_reg-like domain-containing protein n=1 Tax=Dyadobacter koreensis TaxID=408657 RepID=A0A1H6VQG3_9BACT|nr:carboxypeptidase-like regulatory domain-containing protein [Dyadobacter koreensis]SEJ02295.1 CarboxypepD_reg-like domain-containing protein [Dyadobacter koreensis]